MIEDPAGGKRPRAGRVWQAIATRPVWVTAVVWGALFFLPSLLQGDHAFFETDDSLDSVLPWYVILARSGQLFTFSNAAIIPNVMGGIPRNAYPASLHLVSWLFAAFAPFTAFLLQFVLVRVTAFGGAFLLLDRHLFDGERRWLSAGIAASFASSAFWGTYPPLALAGLPFVAYALLELATSTRRLAPLVVLGLYGLAGSLVYVGIFLLPFSLLCIGVGMSRDLT